MKEQIKIVYIDDEVDLYISKYMSEFYQNLKYEIDYQEITFEGEKGYEYLLSIPEVSQANIILIDSRLFENDKITCQGKFTGEEFRIILRKLFPFIEVLVISQNGQNLKYGIIQKYNGSNDNSYDEYYEKVLKPIIDNQIEHVLTFRNISKKLEENHEIEKVLVEKIINSLNGTNKYDELTSKDIDSLVSTFQDLVEAYEENH